MILTSLTVRQRIQLHLLDHRQTADQYEVPVVVTQEGIARAVWIDIRHVSQYIRPLIAEGLVQERHAHIKGGRRKRKAYHLTETGLMAVMRLRNSINSDTIRVRDAEGTHEATVSDVLREVRGVTVLEIARGINVTGSFDTTRPGPRMTDAFVEILSDAPRIQIFIGRDNELRELTSDDGGSRVHVVRGIAGIGKSTLAAKVCELERGSRHLFWHRVRPWDTLRSIMASLGRFLSALGKPGLRAILTGGDLDLAPQVLREDLSEIATTLVFDDAHEAGPDATSLLRFVKDAAFHSPDLRVLVLSRSPVPFYDRRDVVIEPIVKEIDLGGLEGESVQAFFTGVKSKADLAKLGARLGGHPLLLRLLQQAPEDVSESVSLRDVHQFVEETIYRSLSENERDVMKVASLYRVPVPEEALLPDPSVSHEVVGALKDQCLILPIGVEGHEVHDTIREFFVSVCTDSERQSFVPFAVGMLGQVASRAAFEGNLSLSIDSLSNALELSESSMERAKLLEGLGDAHEQIGDLPTALDMYERAIHLREEPVSMARLHRKAATALEVRGELSGARRQIESGFLVLGDSQDAERGWLNLVSAKVASALWRWEEAREHGRAAQAIFRSSGSRRGRAQALVALGNVEINAPNGTPSVALHSFERALELAGSLDDADFTASVHISLANLFANKMASPEEAREHIRTIESLPRALGDPHRRRSFLMLKAWFSLEQEADYQTAADYFFEARALGRTMRSTSTVVFADYGLAHVSYYEGDIEKARARFEEAAEAIRELGFLGYTLAALWMVAECNLRKGDIEAFRRVAAQMRKPSLHQDIDRPISVDISQGLLSLLEGKAREVHSAFEAALQRSREGFPGEEAFPSFFYGIALRVLGEEEEAAHYFGRATDILKAHCKEADLQTLPERETDIVETLRDVSAAYPST